MTQPDDHPDVFDPNQDPNNPDRDLEPAREGDQPPAAPEPTRN
jgi:hypothetical protein